MENPTKNDNPITPFAITNYRDIRKRFGIKQKNRRGHMYLVGKTGTGKSTLLLNMAAHDIEMGYGLALIDPHGDLAEEILESIPEHRIKDVIYLNPADLDYPLAFNPLENVPPDGRYLVASGMISVLKKVWADFWGPRLEHILRHTLLTLLENPGSTLLDVPRLLTDEKIRNLLLRRVTHPQVREFWLSEFAKYSVWLRSEAISPILNKIGQFLTSIPLRNIVGQRQSALDFRKIMDEGKILIVNLAKGKIGEDNCALLGAMIVTKLQLAALSRADIPEAGRRPFYLYVDEFHNFLTLSFADILAEARKYGLNLVLAHQYLLQLDEKLRAAVLGNVGTIICFRVGGEDAKLLSREFYPVFGEADFTNLPNYHIYLKLLIDGAPSKPFSAVTLSPRLKRKSFRHEIIEASRKGYASHLKILKIMETHNYHANRRRKHRFLLNGFVFCNLCGKSFTAEIHPAKNKAYYHCAARQGHSNVNQNVEVSVLEKAIEERFKTIEFSQKFIDLLTAKLKNLSAGQREDIQAKKQAIFNKQKAVEIRRDRAEEKFLGGFLSDGDFVRIKSRLDLELVQIQGQLAELESQRNTDIEVIFEVLRLSKKIYETYRKAPKELKRQYLGLFWQKFLVEDKKIVGAVPTDLIRALLAEKAVINCDEMLPSPPLIITFSDMDKLRMLKARLEQINNYQMSL